MQLCSFVNCIVKRPEFHSYFFFFFVSRLSEIWAWMIAAMLRTISYVITVIVIDAKISRELILAPSDVNRLYILRIW